MAKIFVLVRKGKKNLGVIPAKSKATVSKLKKNKPKVKGFSFKIISQAMLKKLILNKKRKTVKSKRKTRSKVRRKR